MNSDRRVILYIAMSLDGYIAGPGDDLSFLSVVEQEGEDYGYSKFIQTVDTVILGRKTFDWVMKQVAVFPHADLETYVVTRTKRPADGKINFYTGDLKSLIVSLRNGDGKNIFIDGGAEIVNELLKENLIDEFYISVIPILIGDGVRLFRNGIGEQKLVLLESLKFPTGLVENHYRIDFSLKKQGLKH